MSSNGSCRCGLFEGKTGLVMTGCLSVLSCMILMLPGVYTIVREGAWSEAREIVNSWLVRNHWDVEVTQSVWRILDSVDEQHRYLLAGVVAGASLHLLTSLLLLLGSMLNRHTLLLPWLLTDAIIIGVMICLFLSWTFLSFFVNLLIAIVFPVLSGLTIGIWIVMWRHVHDLYTTRFNLKLLEARRVVYRTLPQGNRTLPQGYRALPQDKVAGLKVESEKR